MQAEIWDDPEELLAHEDAWDALWRASTCSLPTARARPLHLWLSRFAAAGTFRAVVVRSGERLAAALPLVSRRIRGVVSSGALPDSPWSPGGCLLVEAPCLDPVIDCLRQGMEPLAWPILWLDSVPRDDLPWQALCRHFEQADWPAEYHEHLPVAVLDTTGDWEDATARWSKNHRRRLRRQSKRLEQEAGVRLELAIPDPADDLDAMLDSMFLIEDRGWKGRNATSVMATPGLRDFYIEQSRMLAHQGETRLARLFCGDALVAYEYGWLAKGTYFSFKVGYNEQFSEFSPGQLLIYHLLEALHADPECRAFNCLGPLTGAMRSWNPHREERLGRLVVAGDAWSGRALLWAYRQLAPPVRRWRDRKRSATGTPAAASSESP